MNRVLVVGSSGSGKTTIAKMIAAHLRCDLIELDSIYHLPNWTPLPDDTFRTEVLERTRPPRWVADGNYPQVAELLWERADTVVWLDLPRIVVTGRVVRRTVGRLIARQTLWNGNRETLSNFMSRRPERNLVLWTWTRHPVYRERYERWAVDPRWSDVSVVRLTSPRQVRAFAGSFGPRLPLS